MYMVDINPHIRFAQQITFTAKESTHYVKDCRILFISDGLAELEIDGQVISLCKNSLFYCCGDKTYTIRSEGPVTLLSLNFDLTQNASFLTMPFTPEEASISTDRTPTDKCQVYDSPFLNSYILIANCSEFEKSITNIITEYATQKMLYRESCSCLLKSLLIRLHQREAVNSMTASDTLSRVIDYIKSNYTGSIKNSELATLAGYHEYHLSRIFRKHTGMSIHQFVINLRLTESKRLLLNTDMSLTQISAMLGFNSITHFSNCFKKAMSLTPSEYKKAFKNTI